MLRKKCALGLVTALGFAAFATQVSGQTLSSLVGAGPVTSGGLVFSNFTAGGTLSPNNVDVTFTATGVQFTANWTTITPFNDSSVISYTVAPVSGTLAGSTLNFSGFSVVNNGAAFVGETLTDTVNNKNYSMQVFFGGNGNPDNITSDTVAFNPETNSLRIVKSIDVAASGPNSSATLNFVENIYTQGGGVTPPIPEPMSLALLPLALLGLGLRRKLAAR